MIKEIIQLISKRAANFNSDRRPVEYAMDIWCVHNTTPLDLEKLLIADDFNFAHDVFGIVENLNRETGELMYCFRPRFTKKQT